MPDESKAPTVFDQLRMRLEQSRLQKQLELANSDKDHCRRRRGSTPELSSTKPAVTTTTPTTFEYLARKPWANITPPATNSSPPAEHSPRYSTTSSPLYAPRSPPPPQHSPRYPSTSTAANSPRYSPSSPQYFPNSPGEPKTAKRVSPFTSATTTPPRHPAGLLFSAKNDIDPQDYELDNISRRLPSPYTTSTVRSSPSLGYYDPAAGYSTPAQPASTVAVLSPPRRSSYPKHVYNTPLLIKRTPAMRHENVLPPIDPRRASLAPSPHPLSLYHKSSSFSSTSSSSSSRPVRPLPSRFVVSADSRSPAIRALSQRLPPIAHLLEHVVDQSSDFLRPAINPMWGSYSNQPSRGQKRSRSDSGSDVEVEEYSRHSACALDCDCMGRRVRKRRYVVIVEEHCPCSYDEPTRNPPRRLPSLSSSISSSRSVGQLATPLSTPEAGSSIDNPICVEDDKAMDRPSPAKRTKRPVA